MHVDNSTHMCTRTCRHTNMNTYTQRSTCVHAQTHIRHRCTNTPSHTRTFADTHIYTGTLCAQACQGMLAGVSPCQLAHFSTAGRPHHPHAVISVDRGLRAGPGPGSGGWACGGGGAGTRQRGRKAGWMTLDSWSGRGLRGAALPPAQAKS